jgi:hypothetical protein
MRMENSSKITLKDLMKCQKCGKKLVADRKAVIFGTRRWDKHSYKTSCECFSKNFRVSIG